MKEAFPRFLTVNKTYCPDGWLLCRLTLPVVCPYNPKSSLSFSSLMASGLSILLPRIRIGTFPMVSSVINACDSRQALMRGFHLYQEDNEKTISYFNQKVEFQSLHLSSVKTQRPSTQHILTSSSAFDSANLVRSAQSTRKTMPLMAGR